MKKRDGAKMSSDTVSCLEEKMANIIPGLPDDLGLQCLARVPRIFHASLRAVNTTWKAVVGGKGFYAVRKKLGVTDESVFMIKKFDNPPSQLHCMEIDLKTKKCSKALFVNDRVSSDIFNEGYGCASVGHLVLFFGGHAFSEDETPSGTLHVFNTLSRTWTNGASMLCPRGEFGYGVIDSKLYVAGGFAGQGVGLVTDAEVYDPEVDHWVRIAKVPAAMHLDIFCVWRNRLLVQGLTWPEKRQLVYSYSPVTNEWQEEEWLVDLLALFNPLVSCARGVTTKKDGTIYVGFAKQSYDGVVMEHYVNNVKVMKLDSAMLKWNIVANYQDEADEFTCECGVDDGQLNLFGLKDRVLVLSHLESEDSRTFRLASSIPAMDMLYVDCPSAWTSTLVDA